MDLPATQACYDYDDTPTQKIEKSTGKEKKEQVGVLIINSNSYPIYEGISKIGRHPECNICLDDQSISKYHAEIEGNTCPTNAWICDLNSSNKTILNSILLRPARYYELKDNSVIKFGRVKAVYKKRRTENDFVIPETPVQSKRKNIADIIPGTPDSLLSNSSLLEGDNSTIAVTQECTKKSVRPRNDEPSVNTSSLQSSKISDEQIEANIRDAKDSTDDDESPVQPDQNEKDQIPRYSPEISRLSLNTAHDKNSYVRNDPSTSCESEDIFEAVTQRVDIDLDLKNSKESTSSEDTNYDEDVDKDDTAATQKICHTFKSSTPMKENLKNRLEEVKNIRNDIALATKCLESRTDPLHSENNTKENESNIEGIHMLETQIVDLPDSLRNAKKGKTVEENYMENLETLDTQIVELPASIRNAENVERSEEKDDTNIDLLETQPINTSREDANASPSLLKDLQPNLRDNGSVEDLDYETASTQILEDVDTVSEKNDKQTKKAGDKRYRKINFNDSLEQKLNDMFDDVNDEHEVETSMISTQSLKNALELSQHSNQVSTTPSNSATNVDPARVNNVKSAESNSQMDSQNTEIYFSNIVSKRKRNVLVDSQDIIDSNIAINTRRKKSKTSNTITLETDKTDKAIPSTCTVDRIENDLLNSFEVSVHSSKSTVECTETSKLLDEKDDDILTRLPEVNISGTLSNPDTSMLSTKKSTRRSANKKNAKISDTSKIEKTTKSTSEDTSDTVEDVDYENLKRMAEQLMSNKSNKLSSMGRRKGAKARRVSTENTTNKSTVGDAKMKKTKGNVTAPSESMLAYVTRKSPRTNARSAIETDSKAALMNSDKKPTKRQQAKESKEKSSGMQENKSGNALGSQVGEESQEVEMIMNNTLVTKPRNTRKRKIANDDADEDDRSLNDANVSHTNQTKDIGYKVPVMRLKRTKFSKSNASQSSIDSMTTDDSSIGDSEDGPAASKAKSRTTRSKRRNKKAQEIAENTSTFDKTVAKNDTSFDREDNGTTPTIAVTPTTRGSISNLSLNTSFSAKEKILFTGITDDEYSKVLRTLGGVKVEDPSKCTILVTDKIRRTIKFLCALAKAVPIVSINWLHESKRAGHFLDWENYTLKDPAMEAKYGFRLRKSLDKARERKLLDGYVVLLTSNIESPPISELKTLITSCGGKALLRPPSKLSAKTIILSNPDNLDNARKWLLKAPTSVTIQSTEFLLTGILKQELDFVRHKLI